MVNFLARCIQEFRNSKNYRPGNLEILLEFRKHGQNNTIGRRVSADWMPVRLSFIVRVPLYDGESESNFFLCSLSLLSTNITLDSL